MKTSRNPPYSTRATLPRAAKPLPQFDERLRYSIADTTRYLGQSRSKTFVQIRDGELPVIREGRRTFVPGAVIAERCGLAAATRTSARGGRP